MLSLEEGSVCVQGCEFYINWCFKVTICILNYVNKLGGKCAILRDT